MCAAQFVDRPFFIPAETAGEAITRIYSLTGAADAGTRGEKRAIVALRDALELDIDLARTNAAMGEGIAEALGVEWRASYAERNKVNLDGLNILLEGATEAYHEGALRRLQSNRPAMLDGPGWEGFLPAPSKIEAVNRISALTNSGSEWLGPGSKEHKSVLVNLAASLEPHLDQGLSKHRLSAALADEFAVPWSDSFESTGQSITLDGLNTLLAGAERKLGQLGLHRSLVLGTPEEEGKALAAALIDGLRPTEQPDGGKRVSWDGRSTCRWMKGEGLTRGPNDNEWQGFFWEEKGRRILNKAFTPNPNPPRSVYCNTPFDYSLRFVWDLKAHTEEWFSPLTGKSRPGLREAPLNDEAAMEECIDDQGLGFLVCNGLAIADDDLGFVGWHREFKLANGVKSRSSNSGGSRMRKAAFEPLDVEVFWFPNLVALEAAKVAGQISGFKQGRQAPARVGVDGKPRGRKYKLRPARARGTLDVARLEYPRRAPKV